MLRKDFFRDVEGEMLRDDSKERFKHVEGEMLRDDSKEPFKHVEGGMLRDLMLRKGSKVVRGMLRFDVEEMFKPGEGGMLGDVKKGFWDVEERRGMLVDEKMLKDVEGC